MTDYPTPAAKRAALDARIRNDREAFKELQRYEHEQSLKLAKGNRHQRRRKAKLERKP